MNAEHYPNVDGALEVREATNSPGRIVGVVLPAGRVAQDRRELFVGTGIETPANGLRLLPEHRSTTTIMEFDPVRDADGTLRIDHILPDSVTGRAAAQSIRDGSTPNLSAEFFSLSEQRVSGVREVRTSLVTAVALVHSGAYTQSRAELRSKREVKTWL